MTRSRPGLHDGKKPKSSTSSIPLQRQNAAEVVSNDVCEADYLTVSMENATDTEDKKDLEKILKGAVLEADKHAALRVENRDVGIVYACSGYLPYCGWINRRIIVINL